ncbi:MAG: regulatory protein RecX [Bryobacterales bacterium]|nr:regulatory protein RecX [Bryobacterales bacterium]
MAFAKRPKTLEQDELLQYAVRLLGGRAQSTGELREKLRRKAAVASDVDYVLAKLKDLDYLNDKRFAEYFATRRLENEGLGKARVMSDLRAKRVAPAVAEGAVSAAFQDVDEVELIEQFLARKYRAKPLAQVLADEKGVASAYRKLRMAGFSSGNAVRVLKRHARDVEGVEGLADSELPVVEEE